MQNKTLTLILGAMLTTGAAFAQAPDQTAAQQTQNQPAAAATAQPNHAPNPERQAKHLKKALNLTKDQTAQIKPILADRAQQSQAVRSDTTLAPQDRKAKLQSIQQDSKTKIEAVLNDQQKQQFEQMLQERRAKHNHAAAAPQS